MTMRGHRKKLGGKKGRGGVRKIQKSAAGNTANKLCEGSKFFKKKRR